MALFYCDGDTKDIQLLIYDDYSRDPKSLGVVDFQQFSGGSECFPMQIIEACWDDSGKWLVYTAAFDRQGHIFDLTDNTTRQISGLTEIQNIEYDSEKQIFKFETQKADQGRDTQSYDPVTNLLAKN